jgi:isoquinoline 1-oxidoreductase beta subunit
MLDGSLMPRLDRRHVLKVGAAFGGGLVLDVTLPPLQRAGLAADAAAPAFAPNAFIRIDREGAVTLVMPMVEMGQGVYTALAMLLAEELEVGLDQVRLEHAPPDDALYANAILHVQTTGLSSSVRAFWTPLRQAGAVGRTLLIAAAAKRWGVDPATCGAKHGVVSDASGARRLGYGELADAAAALPVPAPDSVALKDPKSFALIGTPAKRLDTPDKVNGRAQYGIDTRLPGMGIAAIAISPVFGGKVKSVNEAAARAVKGVRQVVRIDEAVAVVADHQEGARGGHRPMGPRPECDARQRRHHSAARGGVAAAGRGRAQRRRRGEGARRRGAAN